LIELKHLVGSFLLLFSLVHITRAQIPFVQTKSIGEAEGLPYSKVNAIQQDKAGFVWFGTTAGLFRWDGQTLVPFTYQTSRGQTKEFQTIEDLLLDEQGYLWIGTSTGLFRYKPETQYFEDVNLHQANTEVNFNSNIVLINSLPDQEKIVFSTKGIYIFNYQNQIRVSILKNENPFYTDKSNISDFDIKNDSIAWVCSNSNWFVLNFKTGKISNREPIFLKDKEIIPSRFHFYNDSIAYIAHPNGFFQFNLTTWKISPPNNLPKDYVPKIGWMIEEDSKGNIWFNSAFKIYAWNPVTGKYLSFEKFENNYFGLSNDYTLSWMEDQSGNIWLGQWGGIEKANLNSLKFNFFKINPAAKENSPENSVTSVFQSSDSSIWIGTRAGIYLLDRLGEKMKKIEGLPGSKNAQQFPDKIFEDQNGEIYCKLSSLYRYKGLFRYNPLKQNFEPFKTGFALDSLLLLDIQIDDNEPSIWWYSSDKGLCRLDVVGKREQWFLPPVNGEKAIRYFTQLSTGEILGHGYEGLWRLNKSDFSYHHYVHQYDNDASLPDNTSLTSFEFPKGKVWISFRSGLALMDLQNGTFKNFTSSDGYLPSNISSGFIGINDSELWFSTRSRLAKYQLQDSSFHYFGKEHGVFTTFGFQNAIQLFDGTILIGANEGILSYNPEKRANQSNLVSVKLTGIKIKGTPLGSEFEMPFKPKVIMGYQENTISFEFIGLDYLNPENRQYCVRLEGFDTEWRNIGKINIATYTNLDPGAYVFKVKTTNTDGIWGPSTEGLSLVVTPMYWQTLWFKIIISVLILSLIFFILQIIQQRRIFQQQKEIAERNALYKSRFLTNMSHEIRTPLNAIIGLNKLLSATPLNEKQQSFVNAVGQSSENLLYIVNDILDQAKLESGQYQFKSTPFTIDLIIGQVKSTLEHKAMEKHLKLIIDSKISNELVLKGDPIRLYQILINLLNNAIKYTEVGYVKLSISQSSGLDTMGNFHFEIIDSGIGISQKDQEKIFESFHQAEYSTELSESGTGLGLSITQQLVEQQGGTITLQSEPGKGSVFSVTLPFEIIPTDTIKEEKVPETPLEGIYEVLLVEDNVFNQLLATELLKKHLPNATVELAENGSIAISKCREKSFDLILMDIKMPVMDGLKATRQIRNEIGPNQKTVILALTANAIKEKLDECLEAGMNDCITKPVNAKLLLEKLHYYLNPKQQKDGEN
jgi:signal transduction histidine kinase/CheY-like chemotaxis protein/ligand-binding sensor domain-containing protein